MLLRRFMQHVKEQNWFAVGLDVIVVIVGIFLGMQVQEWYEDRTEKERIKAQLASFRNELVLSREQLATRQAYYADRVASANELRARLDSSDEFSAADLNRLIFSTIRGSGLNVTYRGYDEITATGVISKVADEHLRDLLYQWDTQLTMITNFDDSIEETRNLVIIPRVIEAIPFGNALQTDERYQDLVITKRFEYDINAIRADKGFDSMLAMRHVQVKQQLNTIVDFIAVTEALIEALESK